MCEFWRQFKSTKKKSGYSQEDLAEKVHVSRQSVSKWETGDAYPEMNNILELCKIFKCRINDLVNDSILDIDSLDEEVLDSVVRLKMEDQRKVKFLSKTIYILARVMKIILLIALFVEGISILIGNIVLFNTTIDDRSVSLFGHNILIITDDDSVKLSIGEHDLLMAEDLPAYATKDFLESNDKYTVIGFFNVSMISLLIYSIVLIYVLKHLDLLFTSISEGSKPFTLENVHHIKRMAFLMIISIIIVNVSDVTAGLIINTSFNEGLEMFDLIEILFLYSLSYIFEYGYYIQSDSKSVMFGDLNE